MNPPQRCPFCESHDVRTITPTDLDLVGYRCHDCQNMFYAAAVTPSSDDAPVRRANPGTKRPKSSNRDPG
jgi:transposase-like protein